MSTPHWTLPDRPLSKVVAVFRQPEAAEQARDTVMSAAGLDDRQVRLVGPRSAPPGSASRDDHDDVAASAMRAPLTSALSGLSIALVAWSLMYLTDVVVIASTPLPSLVAMALFGTMLGLMVTPTIDADDPLMVDRVRQATRNGRWALVVQPLSLAQFERALAILQATGAPVARTL